MMGNNFNHALFRLARQARGINQKELAERSSVSQGYISKIEQGLMDANDEILEKTSKVLQFPISLFFEKGEGFGLPVSIHPPLYRKKASLTARSMERLEAETSFRIMHYNKLLSAVELEPELLLPRIDPEEYHNDIEHIATIVRRIWSIPRGPIKNLLSLIERTGCIVAHCDFSDMDIDGLTMRVRGQPPCIFLNKNRPADRQRFTLAHELGHLILHSIPNANMEKEADEFASAFLMPAEDIRPYFNGRVSLPLLAQLKLVWRASMASLLYRAGQVGAISSRQSTYLWMHFSKKGYRSKEPPELDFEAEKTTLIQEVLRFHLEDLGYNISDLCKMLNLQPDDIEHWHPIQKKEEIRYLRVVK